MSANNDKRPKAVKNCIGSMSYLYNADLYKIQYFQHQAMIVRIAQQSDENAIIATINKAYEVANFFKYEKRTSEAEIDRYFDNGCFVVAEDEGNICGCVYLKITGNEASFELLSVLPEKQGKGLGDLLMAEVEKMAIQKGCTHMDIQIVNLRTELHPYYTRRGYLETGIEPFPKASKFPCHFINMRKELVKSGIES